MSLPLDALSELTNLTPYTPARDDELSITVHDQNFNNLVSSSFNKVSETHMEYKEMINLLSQAPYTSDPQSLAMLQSYIGEYSNYVSLVSTLARKGVSTIETLEKSQ